MIPEEYQGDMFVSVYIVERGEFEVCSHNTVEEFLDIKRGREKMGYKLVGSFTQVNIEFLGNALDYVREHVNKLKPESRPDKVEIADIVGFEFE